MTPNLPSYNFAPNPSVYSSTFGGIPGQVAPAPSIYQQAAGVAPQLPSLTAGTAGVVGNELAGKLSPETLNAIKDNAAVFGVGSGMPGSGLGANLGLRNVGLNTQQLQSQGVGDYLHFLTGLGSTQTNPAVTQDVAMWNATNAAAPNPAAAEQYLMDMLHPRQASTFGSGGLENYFTPAGSNTKLPLSAAYA